MISSMTGFGRAEFSSDNRKITVELKSVNHKYFDVNIKMPRKFNAFEGKIRNLLKKYAVRGKIDMFITFEDRSESFSNLFYNSILAGEYFNYYKLISEEFGIENDIRTSLIARAPEVLSLEDGEIKEDEIWEELSATLSEAFAAFKEARTREGEALKADILLKLEDMEKHVAFIEERLPQIIEEYKAKLKENVKELLENNIIDEARIAGEVVMYSDKIAVDEELVRLKSHIKNMTATLNRGGAVGRNLDFIAQEMNREANTILSKSGDIDVTNCGIELKTLIEKIREQVQNIE